MNIGKILGVAAGLVAGAAVAVSIWLNPPAENRARAMDMERGWRLSRIESAIVGYHRLENKLPASLEELVSGNSVLSQDNLRDPVTGEVFGYEIVDETSYRLCANFERSTENDNAVSGVRRHKSGRDCFDQKVTTP